jgi:hypothetical protein
MLYSTFLSHNADVTISTNFFFFFFFFILHGLGLIETDISILWNKNDYYELCILAIGMS